MFGEISLGVFTIQCQLLYDFAMLHRNRPVHRSYACKVRFCAEMAGHPQPAIHDRQALDFRLGQTWVKDGGMVTLHLPAVSS